MTAPDTHERLHRLALRLGRLAFDCGLPAEPARAALLLCRLVWAVMGLQVSHVRLARAARAVGRVRLIESPRLPARLDRLRLALAKHRRFKGEVVRAASRLADRQGAAGAAGRTVLRAVGLGAGR